MIIVFAVGMRGYEYKDWTIEQRWCAVLLFGLMGYNSTPPHLRKLPYNPRLPTLFLAQTPSILSRLCWRDGSGLSSIK